MSKENFAEKMKVAKEKKTKKEERIKEIIDLKAGDEIGVEVDGVEEKIVLDVEQAEDLNKQINDDVEVINVKVEPEIAVIETIVNLEENVKTSKEKIEAVEITSVETQVISSQFENFNGIIFNKNEPIFLTDKVLKDLLKLSNFKALVDSGVIKIGL